MNDTVEERAVILGEYIVENRATVRAAAKVFSVSKSTVHMDVAERLRRINPGLYTEVREVLEVNKAERHIRGGQATKQKYLSEKNNKAKILSGFYTAYILFFLTYNMLYYHKTN